MKRRFCLWMFVLFFISFGLTDVLAGEENEENRLTFVFGPRVGATYVVVSKEDFNASLQNAFPRDSAYFPLITQFGLNLEQRIRLGDTESHFAFQEVIVVGGLDQGIVLPSFSCLIGFRSKAGLEFGLGPNVTLSRSPEGLGVAVSVIYALGWTFSIQDVHIPVDIAIVPTPVDGCPRISLLTGFNFGGSKRKAR